MSSTAIYSVLLNTYIQLRCVLYRCRRADHDLGQARMKMACMKMAYA